MTVPPLKATVSAAARLPERAASLVREFANVAACMPIRPAITEQAAPTAKLRAMRAPNCQPINPATTTTKIASMRYSRYRNAIAPTRIRPAT